MDLEEQSRMLMIGTVGYTVVASLILTISAVVLLVTKFKSKKSNQCRADEETLIDSDKNLYEPPQNAQMIELKRVISMKNEERSQKIEQDDTRISVYENDDEEKGPYQNPITMSDDNYQNDDPNDSPCDLKNEKATLYARTSTFQKDELEHVYEIIDNSKYASIENDVSEIVFELEIKTLEDLKEEKRYETDEKINDHRTLMADLENILVQIITDNLENGNEKKYGGIDDNKLNVYCETTKLHKDEISELLPMMNTTEFKAVASDIKWITLRLQSITLKELRKETMYKDPCQNEQYQNLLDEIQKQFREIAKNRFGVDIKTTDD